MSEVKVTEEQVENFIVNYDVSTIKDKTTLVVATLKNGFVITESSSCVDPANYDEAVGAEICKEKIKDQVWHLLGFDLQQKQYEQTFLKPYEALTKAHRNTVKVFKEDLTGASENGFDLSIMTKQGWCSRSVFATNLSIQEIINELTKFKK